MGTARPPAQSTRGWARAPGASATLGWGPAASRERLSQLRDRPRDVYVLRARTTRRKPGEQGRSWARPRAGHVRDPASRPRVRGWSPGQVTGQLSSALSAWGPPCLPLCIKPLTSFVTARRFGANRLQPLIPGSCPRNPLPLARPWAPARWQSVWRLGPPQVPAQGP